MTPSGGEQLIGTLLPVTVCFQSASTSVIDPLPPHDQYK